MKNMEKAKIILSEVNEMYSIPVYMEKYVMKAILKALSRIEEEEKER